MKTSFYFVVWIVIYPLMGLLGNQWINSNSFLVALVAVWGLSWLINRSMPHIIAYERRLSYARIMDEVYTGNVEGFRKRIERMTVVEFVSALYFGVTFVFTVVLMFKAGVPDWLALIVFGLLAAGTIIKASRLQQAALRLRRNPVQDESIAVSRQTLGMNYEAYYNERHNNPGGSLLPPAPPGFKSFQILSLVMAVVCGILGVLFIVLAIISFGGSSIFGLRGQGIISLLYGSLAAYFGCKDCIDIINYFRLPKY